MLKTGISSSIMEASSFDFKKDIFRQDNSTMVINPAVFWTLTSCSCNTVLMELLSKSSGNNSSYFGLLTFTTFLLMAVEGLVRHPEFLRTCHIPMSSYASIVLIFFLVSVGNNYVLSFSTIPFPLVIIFRSGTLVANVLLTWYLQNRRYSLGRIFSVLLITAGIVLFTLAGGDDYEKRKNNEHIPVQQNTDLLWSMEMEMMPSFILGVLIMSATMFASAYLGILQEKLFMLHGKHPEEMMFYVHFLSLPLFLFVGHEIKADLVDCWNANNATWNIHVFGTFALPSRLFILLSTTILQLICIRSVYQLAAQLNSFQLTMVLTLRKFLNILFSVLIFRNQFGLQHWVSSALVLGGYFAFYDGYAKAWHWIADAKIGRRTVQKDKAL